MAIKQDLRHLRMILSKVQDSDITTRPEDAALARALKLGRFVARVAQLREEGAYENAIDTLEALIEDANVLTQ